jgi:hypothetical protein
VPVMSILSICVGRDDRRCWYTNEKVALEVHDRRRSSLKEADTAMGRLRVHKRKRISSCSIFNDARTK